MSEPIEYEKTQAEDLRQRAKLCHTLGFHYAAELFTTAARYAERKAEILEQLEMMGDRARKLLEERAEEPLETMSERVCNAMPE